MPDNNTSKIGNLSKAEKEIKDKQGPAENKDRLPKQEQETVKAVEEES